MISTGDKLPSMDLMVMTEDGPAKQASSEIFDGKKVVLFAVPGAFTPTCTLNHLPGYVENSADIKAKGVDEIAVIAVNDPFVTKAWADQANAKGKVTFLSDWDAGFTKAIGMETDLSAAGLGQRSKRYSMIVENGTVTALNVEDSPGEATASGAAKMLEIL